MRSLTTKDKAVETVGMILGSAAVVAAAWAMLTLGWLLSPAHAECVEDAMNRPGRDGAYPTGCFVKPVPVEPSNCVSWNNIGPNKVCTNYREEPETVAPEEPKVLIPESEVFHPDGDPYKDHWFAAGQNICLRDLADLKFAYDWYVTNHGAWHGATQIYAYRLAVKQLDCKQFKVELTDFGPVVNLE